MDIIALREFCLSLPFAEETTPFDQDTLVYKIAGKMFAYAGMTDFRWVAVKCDPGVIEELIETCEYARYAPHMSKKHWLGIDTTGDVPASFIREKVRNSYRLVVDKMPKKVRDEITAAIRETGFDL